eukprot:scaffold401_cov399-Prasinococcus_capsulatus_cf.AAC.33
MSLCTCSGSQHVWAADLVIAPRVHACLVASAPVLPIRWYDSPDTGHTMIVASSSLEPAGQLGCGKVKVVRGPFRHRVRFVAGMGPRTSCNGVQVR